MSVRDAYNVLFNRVELSASADVDVSSIGFAIERHSSNDSGCYLIDEVPAFVKGTLQLPGDVRDKQC